MVVRMPAVISMRKFKCPDKTKNTVFSSNREPTASLLKFFKGSPNTIQQAMNVIVI